MECEGSVSCHVSRLQSASSPQPLTKLQSRNSATRSFWRRVCECRVVELFSAFILGRSELLALGGLVALQIHADIHPSAGLGLARALYFVAGRRII